MESLASRLAAYGDVKEHESMRTHTTFHIGGEVDYYIQPENETSLMCVLDILQESKIPYYILGRGSNLLFDDGPFHGAIINLDKKLNDYWFEPGGILTAQAGCSIIHLANQCAGRSLSGMEFASGIPGSVGGALYMNAGAYKSSLSDILLEVCVLKDGEISWMKKEELEYGYRHSLFQKHKDWIILAGKFVLDARNQKEIYELMDSRRQRRMDSQPLSKPCAGSVFRNPASVPAWKLIEKMGFRGLQIGGARVSEKHCNFIVNEDGKAKASDVLELIERIQKKAAQEYGIELITEVEHLSWAG